MMSNEVERPMEADEIQVMDLGDAVKKTKQPFYWPEAPDSAFGLGPRHN